jgi:hypothetical protein
MGNVAIPQAAARGMVDLVDVYLLQPTRQASATFRGSNGADHPRALIIHWIAPDIFHRKMRQARVGCTILPNLKHKAVGLRATAVAWMRYLRSKHGIEMLQYR